MGDSKHSEMVNACMDQFNLFRSKTGEFSDPSIWENQDALNGRSHVWHFHKTNPSYPELGFVAMRVTSKLLGIGSAERAWGTVKHLKNDKRSHLSAKVVEKQSSIFGQACIEHARIKSSDNDHNTWNSENIDDEHFLGELMQSTINTSRLTHLVQTPSSRELLYPSSKVGQGTHKFKAFLEDW